MSVRWPAPRAFCAAALALLSGTATAQPADTVFVNGKIIRYDAPIASALAVQGSTIAAVGGEEDVKALIATRTRVIDLGGRTVIPGLIDSHIHAIRAGLTWRTEVSWIGVRSLVEALARIRDKAQSVPAGAWLVIAGGWTPAQFAEDRTPTREELEAAAPNNPAFVQLFYSRVLLNRRGAEALGLSQSQALGPQLQFETDAAGRPTGWIKGHALAISELFNRLPRPGLEESIAGTRDFFRELNKVGVTGVDDPGGYNLTRSDYQALFALWRDHRLSLRVRYSICAPAPSRELQDFETLTQLLPMGFGDAWLRFNGIGETVTWGMYNNDQPSPADQQHLGEVLRWAAARGLTATFHWNNERSVHFLLDVIERVNADMPIAKLRWSIAHIHDASESSLQRMQALGVGWLMQNAFYFRGEAFLAQRGIELVRSPAPIMSAVRMGLHVGAGTDAHRVMWFSPFVALQWMVDGKTISGLAMRSPSESPSRIEALRLFTEGSAWFSFDEERRGSIASGKLADLVVLSDDYLSVPTEEIGKIHSVMTMVGGRIVFASGLFAPLESEN
jgi:predicted amidohydrolase YtcJ